jgi:SAM-dependent methyltransferase
MTSEVWEQFWAAEQRGRGCLSGAPQPLELAQRHFWQEFATRLPKGARVLDLGTGNGIVMKWLVSTRRDLKPLGVDFATRIPPTPKGCRVRAGVRMEALPLPDGSQDAVVSQFGVEYGELPKVLAEIRRVLKASGRVALMTHRVGGPILEHNQRRRASLAWALESADLVVKAKASLSLRHIGLAMAPALRAAPAEAAARFGPGSAAWEFAEALVQTLLLGRGDSDSALLSAIDELEAKARSEIGRIDALERACLAVADAAELQRQFAASGLGLVSSTAVQEKAGRRAFADAWLLRKSATAR